MKYYFDTSIWLDWLEDRNEPNLPKAVYAEKLITKIIAKSRIIVYSDAVEKELSDQGYYPWEVEKAFEPFRRILEHVDSTEKQFKRAKDLSAKRKVPIFDALHALIARENKAAMITRDRDFAKLKDIVKPIKPENVKEA